MIWVNVMHQNSHLQSISSWSKCYILATTRLATIVPQQCYAPKFTSTINFQLVKMLIDQYNICCHKYLNLSLFCFALYFSNKLTQSPDFDRFKKFRKFCITLVPKEHDISNFDAFWNSLIVTGEYRWNFNSVKSHPVTKNDP